MTAEDIRQSHSAVDYDATRGDFVARVEKGIFGTAKVVRGFFIAAAAAAALLGETEQKLSQKS